MNPVANFLNLLRFQPAEYVPYGPPIYELSYYGAFHEGWDNPLSHDSPLGTKWIDTWGVGWYKLQPGMMAMPELHPLADPASLAGYHWPSADEERINAQVYRMAATYQAESSPEQLLLAASHRDTLWEKAYMLVGMENMMMYFKSEPEYVREILHRIMDFQLGMARHYMRLGVRFASLGDDLGAQHGALLGPRIVRDFIVPEYRRLFQFYKDNDVLIGFHCCGNLDSVLDVFFDLGVDILNPLQASANDLQRVRAITQGRMALQGGVNSAVIIDGPPERIEAEVRLRLRQLGQDGGYVCCPDQVMPFPPENLAAVRTAVERWGRYPLSSEDGSGKAEALNDPGAGLP